MKKIILSAMTLIVLSSCTQRTPEKEPTMATPTQQTPEVLEETNLFSSSMDFKRGYNNNILEDLYREAVEKNTPLTHLEKEITTFKDYKFNQLKNYHSYLRTNRNYWNSAQSLIHQINDSVLSSTLANKFKQLEGRYQTSIQSLTDEKEIIDKKEQLFNDKYHVMKLMITLNMIANYQKNEKPALETIQKVTAAQEEIIHLTEKNTPN